MASQRTKCWRPVQKAPRLTELSLWSEEDFLIVQRLRQKYNCSKLPCKAEWSRPCSYPASKTVVPHLPTEKVQIKREPLTPVSSFQQQHPQQASMAPATPTYLRCLLDPGSQARDQDSAPWNVATVTDSKPAVGSPKKWGHRNLAFFPPPSHTNSQSSDQRIDAVGEVIDKGSAAEFYQCRETFSPDHFFLSQTKEKSPFLKSSLDPGAMWKHKRGAVGTSWNAKDPLSCSSQQNSGSWLSPKSREKDFLQNHDRCHLTVDSSDNLAIDQNWMPCFSKYFSTDERSGQELTSRKATKTSSLPSRNTPQCTVSSDDHCKPMLDLSEGKKNCTVTSAGSVSAYGISPVGRKHRRKPEPGWKTPPHVRSQTQRYTASATGIFLESSTQRREDEPSPVSTAVTLNTGFFPTSHTVKRRKHSEVTSLAETKTDTCTDKRGDSKMAVQHKRSEKRSVAEPRATASAGKATGREKNQRTLTSYSGIVKRKKTSSERGAHMKQVEEGVEDPLSGIITAPQQRCEEIAASEGRERAGSERQGVREITAMTSQHRQQLACLLQGCRLLSCLVLYEDGTTNTDCSLFTRPQVEGVLLHCEEESYMFPVPQRCHDVATNQWVRGVLKGVLRKEETVKVAINCKHLVISLMRDFSLGGQREAVEWRFQDPLVGGWLLKPDHPPHSLHHLCRSFHLHHNQEGGPDRDLQASLAVMEEVKVSLQEQKVWALFLLVEMPLCPLLAAMELQPLRVNVSTLRAFSTLLRKKMEEVEKQAHQLAGHSFCINSTQQLRQLLYEELRLDQQLPGCRRVTLTASAQHKSTSEAVLKQLVPFHPLPALILEYRHLCKLKSTYIEGILECVEGGVVHTHWDQTSAATGRLVSAHPNLQAFPKTPTTITDCQGDRFIVGAEAKSCEIYAREPFIANDGHVFLAADFQQIELRLLAHLARDPALRDMFRADLQSADIFIQLTAQWLSKAYADVSHAEREQTKRVVYSIMYGVGKERLAEYLKVSSSRAKDIMDSFLVSFPAIQMFTRKCVDYAQKHGYTETIMGRRRWLAAVQDKAASVRAQAQAQRQAVNFCLQGSAADLCKRAMVRVEQALRAKPHLTARLLMHIHDELVWELPQDQLKEMCEVVKGVMEDDGSLCRPLLPGLSVALSVSLSSGTSWAHLKPWP